MPHAPSRVWPVVLTLVAATMVAPAERANAQRPVPEKYRAQAEEAARAEGITTDVTVPIDPASDEAARAARRAADSLAATTPQATPLIVGTVEIARGAHRDRLFDVPPGSHCTLTGTLDGAGRAFDVLVFPGLDMLAWKTDPRAGKPVWESESTKAATLSVALPGAGRYALVISNRTAWFLRRRITVKAQLMCTRDWPPD